MTQGIARSRRGQRRLKKGAKNYPLIIRVVLLRYG